MLWAPLPQQGAVAQFGLKLKILLPQATRARIVSVCHHAHWLHAAFSSFYSTPKFLCNSEFRFYEKI
jgi:hypothetical protein